MGDVERSETRYARSGDLSIAYQVVGDGPFDLVYVPGSTSHVELGWEVPGIRRIHERLAAFSRLIIDPWPARPRAVSRIQAMPFSAASIRYIRRPRTVVLKPPTSPTASVQPSSSSAC